MKVSYRFLCFLWLCNLCNKVIIFCKTTTTTTTTTVNRKALFTNLLWKEGRSVQTCSLICYNVLVALSIMVVTNGGMLPCPLLSSVSFTCLLVLFYSYFLTTSEHFSNVQLKNNNLYVMAIKYFVSLS